MTMLSPLPSLSVREITLLDDAGRRTSGGIESGSGRGVRPRPNDGVSVSVGRSSTTTASGKSPNDAAQDGERGGRFKCEESRRGSRRRISGEIVADVSGPSVSIDCRIKHFKLRTSDLIASRRPVYVIVFLDNVNASF